MSVTLALESLCSYKQYTRSTHNKDATNIEKQINITSTSLFIHKDIHMQCLLTVHVLTQ